ncbi:MAG: PKD domain-containing protein [Bacteroidia bacterium]|nr:PKD domain-containing protein [Bacteroidia bacterium]
MKSTLTKLATGLLLLTGLGANAQCALNASVAAVPTTSPGLNYNITGSWTGVGATAVTDYIAIWETGTFVQGTNSLNYTFPGSGNYTVCYYVEDSSFFGSMCYDSTCIIVPVNGNGVTNCNSTFTAYNNANGNVTLQGTATVPQGWVTTYVWSYGNGTSGSGNPVNYTYPVNGNYTVGLTTYSYDPNDTTQYCSSSATGSVNVTNAAGGGGCTLVANVWANADSVNSLSYTILGTYSGGTNTSDYTIVDGNIYYNVDTVQYTFPTSGSYNVCYYVEDSTVFGYCFDSTCVLINVGSPVFGCNAAFTLWPDSFNTSIYYGYNNSTSGPGTTYLWSFGDGTSSTAQYPQHTYASTGFYQVCLTITDSANSCTDTYCDSAGVFKMAGGISQINIIDPASVSVKETANAVSINVFPNPLTENSSITIASDKAMKVQMNIVNVMGQTISTEQVIVNSGKNNLQLKTNELSNGIYFLNIYDGNKLIKNIKLVK